MLPELVAAARRFADEGTPVGAEVKPRSPRWVIEIDPDGMGFLKGPYRRREHREILGPDRQHSGQVSETNLKPLLLMDEARVALGIPAPGKEREAERMHRAFVDLARQLHARTGDPDIAAIVAFLERPLPPEIRERVAPGDLVTFQTSAGEFPVEREEVQRFWSEHLEKELRAPSPAACSVCGREGFVLRLLPRDVVVLGQKCALISFNEPAFESFGKTQTTNVPLCYGCASAALGALDHLLRDPSHHATVARDQSKGRPNSLRNQVAVFWLRTREQVSLAGTRFDLEAALAALQEEPAAGVAGTPPPDLAQLQVLLEAPWTSRAEAAHLSTNSFHLAVLSANKGRLMVREWIHVALDDLRRHVAAYLAALRIVDPRGQQVRGFAIASLMRALASTNPHLTRGLLRTAYLGLPPPLALVEPTLQRFGNPKVREHESDWHALAALLKLVLTHGREEARAMERLDPSRADPAYHCGRVLAVLEEAQRRASGGRLNTTLVDRFYGSASTTPAATLGALIRQAEMAHLPKVRRKNQGQYDQLRRLLEEVLGRFDPATGLPRVLSVRQQAAFALGFYHQRAEFRPYRSTGRS